MTEEYERLRRQMSTEFDRILQSCQKTPEYLKVKAYKDSAGEMHPTPPQSQVPAQSVLPPKKPTALPTKNNTQSSSKKQRPRKNMTIHLLKLDMQLRRLQQPDIFLAHQNQDMSKCPLFLQRQLH